MDDSEAVHGVRVRPWLIGAVAVLVGGFLIAELGSYVSPWVIFGCCFAVMVIADVFGLAVVARRSTRRTAVLCGAVGLIAFLVQAGGIYLTLLFLDRMTFPGAGWFFWTLPAVAVGLSAALLGLRTHRRYGWAVLIGSVEGFAGFIGFFVALIAACDCLD